MRLSNPFAWLEPRVRARILPVLMISTLALFATVVVIDAPLRTPVAPAGMLSFQFAGDLPTALTIMQAWGTLGQIHAALSLGLDYFFLFVYANAISMT